MTPPTTHPVRWTISDLEGFPDNGNRYEIIEGELFATRAPHFDHQNVAGAIYAELRAWSKASKLGKAVMTPGIIFSESDNVIPDVVWVSNERLVSLLDEAGHLTGAPELVVEVLSQSEKDRKRDRETKLKLYSVQGVVEYWICDRLPQTLEIYQREEGLLRKAKTLFATDAVTSPLLPEFRCSVQSFFETF
ncbi:MAG: Uma2 family endonuclease [Synechococcales bacterium]|nr:Uma2 family endonuclease [Synechococcales bacterium]